MIKKVRGYVFSRSFLGERVPQHIQNIVIRDYCEKNNLQFLLSASEYAMENSHLIFTLLLDELNSIDGIALYSIFQLPENTEQRELIYKKVLSLGKTLHFCVEGLKISNTDEKQRIENIWLVKKAMIFHPIEY
jgi:sporadic carbohydrate cluster protein (TIGR04323 family)